jgi:flagellar biosynthesis/type III secretory pathway protein FliH
LNNATPAKKTDTLSGTATKPDWAERLQRTFRRKYDLGYSVGHAEGYDKGFLDGSRKALTEARKVFIKRITKEMIAGEGIASEDTQDALRMAIQLIGKIK